MATTTSVPGQRSPLATVWRILVGLLIAASFGIWLYAFSGRADRPPPDLLVDTDAATRAEAVCAAAVADVAAMPSALDAVDGPDRARQVRQSTDRFEAMVIDLAAIETTDPADQVILEGFVEDWRALLVDRRTYADAVAIDPGATFLLTNVATGERLDRRITRVATTNGMRSCAAPSDV